MTALAIGASACGEDQGGTTDALGRWRQDFCALGLPPPGSGDFARVDCRDANACGSGNCAILVRWNDGRGDRRGAGDSQSAESREREFRFCTRIATAI